MLRFLVSRILRVNEPESLGHRRSRAKYAAAFFRNSSSILCSRVSRSSSRSRARSFTVSGGSSPACSRRQALTQLPRVPSLMPSSFATLAIGRDVSITIFTASSLNSGEKLFFGRGNYFTFPDIHPNGWTVRKPRGTSTNIAWSHDLDEVFGTHSSGDQAGDQRPVLLGQLAQSRADRQGRPDQRAGPRGLRGKVIDLAELRAGQPCGHCRPGVHAAALAPDPRLGKAPRAEDTRAGAGTHSR